MATSGDFPLATSGDYSMAADSFRLSVAGREAPDGQAGVLIELTLRFRDDRVEHNRRFAEPQRRP